MLVKGKTLLCVLGSLEIRFCFDSFNETSDQHVPKESNPGLLGWNQSCCHYTRDAFTNLSEVDRRELNPRGLASQASSRTSTGRSTYV